MHFQDWLIRSCLALYDKGNGSKVTAVGILEPLRVYEYPLLELV